jgi:hypothetical protein
MTSFAERLRGWRPWRFGLCTLFVAITAGCVWLSNYTARLQHQRAVEQMRRQGFELFWGAHAIEVQDFLNGDRNKRNPHALWSVIFSRHELTSTSEAFPLFERIRGGNDGSSVDCLVICQPYSLLHRTREDVVAETPFGPRGFWDHQLTRAELRPLSQLTNIKLASITTDHPTAEVVRALSGCRSLEFLHLDALKLQSAELRTLLKLPHLKTLVLRSVQLQDAALVDDFRSNQKLQKVAFVRCNLSTEFAEQIEAVHPHLILHATQVAGRERTQHWNVPLENGWEFNSTTSSPAATNNELPLPNVGELPKFESE